MTRTQLVKFCLAQPHAQEDYPFGEDVTVFKVGGKMFALVLVDAEPPRVNLKCDPDLAVALRAQYPAVIPGYHSNKRHWNTVIVDGSIDDEEIEDMIEHSYDLVFKSLTRKVRDELG